MAHAGPTAWVLNAADLAPRRQREVGEAVAVAANADLSLLAAVDAAGVTQLWDAADALLAVLPAPPAGPGPSGGAAPAPALGWGGRGGLVGCHRGDAHSGTLVDPARFADLEPKAWYREAVELTGLRVKRGVSDALEPVR